MIGGQITLRIDCDRNTASTEVDMFESFPMVAHTSAIRDSRAQLISACLRPVVKELLALDRTALLDRASKADLK